MNFFCQAINVVSGIPMEQAAVRLEYTPVRINSSQAFTSARLKSSGVLTMPSIVHTCLETQE